MYCVKYCHKARRLAHYSGVLTNYLRVTATVVLLYPGWASLVIRLELLHNLLVLKDVQNHSFLLSSASNPVAVIFETLCAMHCDVCAVMFLGMRSVLSGSEVWTHASRSAKWATYTSLSLLCVLLMHTNKPAFTRLFINIAGKSISFCFDFFLGRNLPACAWIITLLATA